MWIIQCLNVLSNMTDKHLMNAIGAQTIAYATITGSFLYFFGLVTPIPSTFAVVDVWSLSIGLAIAVFGFMFILLQLFQSQLSPATQRCFAHPVPLTTERHT